MHTTLIYKLLSSNIDGLLFARCYLSEYWESLLSRKWILMYQLQHDLHTATNCLNSWQKSISREITKMIMLHFVSRLEKELNDDDNDYKFKLYVTVDLNLGGVACIDSNEDILIHFVSTKLQLIVSVAFFLFIDLCSRWKFHALGVALDEGSTNYGFWAKSSQRPYLNM